jgi:GntR family transcriptional regulator, transcriptional repressor for pyruvate dehydrogenase complex
MNDKIFVKPVERLALIDQVLDKIGKLIVENKLKPGDLLPSENDFSKMLNVSRTTLRQALKALNILGVLVMKPGSRTYLDLSISRLLINPMKFMSLIHDVDLIELFETRKYIEVLLAKLAAININNKDLKNMENILVKAKESINNKNAYLHYEMQFHEAIFEASNNRILSAFMASINNLLRESREETAVLFKNLETTLKQHYKIFDAIKEKNPEKAAQCMLEHLTNVEAVLKRNKKSN